ncbi:MAG: hypothetical protein QXH42_00550 [Thermoplasmata archaeon]
MSDDAVLKKRRRRAVALVALLIVLPPLLYFVVIPRTELKVRVFYNEGVLNRINIDPELRNAGTLALERVILRVEVVDSKDSEMGEREYRVSSVPAFAPPHRLDALTFRGDQYDSYTIIITIEFVAGGKCFKARWSHTTGEPWMNQEWEDTVLSF